jgi:hypothetical protein
VQIEYPTSIPENVGPEDQRLLKEMGVSWGKYSPVYRQHAALALDRKSATSYLAHVIRRDHPNGKVVSYYGSPRDVVFADVIHLASKPYYVADITRLERVRQTGHPCTTDLIGCDVGAMVHVYLDHDDMVRHLTLCSKRQMYVMGHKFLDHSGTIATADYEVLGSLDRPDRLRVRMVVEGNAAPYDHPLPLWDRFEGRCGRLAWEEVGSTKWHTIYRFRLVDGLLATVPKYSPVDLPAEGLLTRFEYRAFTYKRRLLLEANGKLELTPKDIVADVSRYISAIEKGGAKDKLTAARRKATQLLKQTEDRRLMAQVESVAVSAWLLSLRSRIEALSGASQHSELVLAHDYVTENPTSSVPLGLALRSWARKRRTPLAATSGGLTFAGAAVMAAPAKLALGLSVGGVVGVAVGTGAYALSHLLARLSQQAARKRVALSAPALSYMVSAAPPDLRQMLEWVEIQNMGLARVRHTNEYLLHCPFQPSKLEPRPFTDSAAWAVKDLPPLAFDKSASTALNAIKNRLFLEPPHHVLVQGQCDVILMSQLGRKVWEEKISVSPVYKALRAYLALVKPGSADSWDDLKDWLKGKTLSRAKALLAGDLDAMSMQDLTGDRERAGAFTKMELFVPTKPSQKSRIVVSATEPFQCATAISVLACAEASYSWVNENCRGVRALVGLDAAQLSLELQDVLRPGWKTYDADLSNCDARQRVEWVTPLLISVMRAAKCPDAAIKAIALNEACPVYVFKCVDSDGEMVKLAASSAYQGLRSGDTWTTFANTLIATIVADLAWARSGCDRQAGLIVVGGDDAVIAGEPYTAAKLAEALAQIYEEMGHKLEVGEGMAFYSSVVCPAETMNPLLHNVASPAPGKILAKTGFPLVPLGPRAAACHARALAHCLCDHFSHMPVIRRLLDAVIRNTVTLTRPGLGLVGDSPTQYWGRGLCAVANDETMQWFCDRYDTTRAEVEEVERGLDALTSPPPYLLTHPLFRRMALRDIAPQADLHDLYEEYGVRVDAGGAF